MADDLAEYETACEDGNLVLQRILRRVYVSILRALEKTTFIKVPNVFMNRIAAEICCQHGHHSTRSGSILDESYVLKVEVELLYDLAKASLEKSGYWVGIHGMIRPSFISDRMSVVRSVRSVVASRPDMAQIYYLE